MFQTATAEQWARWMHQEWLMERIKDGYLPGYHPHFVPYDKLPAEQQMRYMLSVVLKQEFKG